jgi:predicted permease
LNPVVLCFAGLVSIASGVAFGLVPAVRLSSARLGARSLRPSSSQRGGTVSRRASHTLIAVEIALALVLLAGSSLMIRSLLRLHAVDLGFDPSRFVALDVSFVDRSRLSDISRSLLARVQGLPDIGIVGAGTGLPLGGSYSRGADLNYLDGTPTTEPENGWDTRAFVPGYFEAVGLRRVAGRWPSDADCAAPMLPIVVNESAARRLFGTAPAVGQQIISRQVVHHIAAVAGDVRHSGPQEDVVSEIYFCQNDPGAPRGGPFGAQTIVVRTDRDPADVAALLRAAVLGLGERFTTLRIRSGDELYAEVTKIERHRTALLTILGALGLTLAIVGVFGMTAYAVTRRTREIGVRMAFGARPRDVVVAVVKDAAIPAAVGLAVGLVAAFVSTPVLGTFLFQMTPHDPWAFGWAAAVLMGTVLLAAWVPARRAARVDPVEALRAE